MKGNSLLFCIFKIENKLISVKSNTFKKGDNIFFLERNIANIERSMSASQIQRETSNQKRVGNLFLFRETK
jgi:hypothetical protein